MSCTLVNTKDLVAYSGFRRVAENITPATQGDFTTAIRDEMVAAGWTELSSGSDANGPSYELLSCQSPWFDPLNIPSWYENQLYIQFRNTAAGVITIVCAAWDGAASYMRSDAITNPPMRLRFSGVASNWFVHASPYQLVVWHATTPAQIPFSVDSRQFIGATLNLPRFIQEQGVQNMLFATMADIISVTSGGFFSGANNGRTWSAHNKVSGADQTYNAALGGTRSVQFPMVSGQILTDNYNSGALWRQSSDTIAQDPSVWQPFIQPVYLMYPLATSTSVVTINGFLWDIFLVTRWQSFLAEATILASRWLNLHGHAITTTGTQGAMFLIMDEIGV